jgi:hypothetical protein
LGNFVPPHLLIKPVGLQYIATEFVNIISSSRTASSAPNFLALAGATCRCFKPVGPVNISIAQCTHDNYITIVSNISALKDSADLLAAEFVGDVREGLTDFINPAAGIGVTPMPDLLYFPWSFSVYDDKKKAGYNRSRGIQLNPSLITLTPAPGEYLDLNFTVRGQFMEPTDSTAYIQVCVVPTYIHRRQWLLFHV